MSAKDFSFSGEILGSARGPVHHFPAGRVCEEAGCETRLSIYNSRRRCAVHDFDETLLHFRTLPTISTSISPAPRCPRAEGGGRLPAHRPDAA